MNTPKLYRDIAAYITGLVSQPLRGIVVAVPDDFLSDPAPLVSVRVTPSGASYARTLPAVPWAVAPGQGESGRAPAPGDFVTLVFKGGSSEFPAVVAYYPGPGSSDAALAAAAGRAPVPAAAIAGGAKSPVTVGTPGETVGPTADATKVLGVLDSGAAADIIDREGRAACAEFASRVIQAAGLPFPLTTSAVAFPSALQALGITGHPFAQARPGDVICWEGVPGYGASGDGGHIAIYEGDLKISESDCGVINLHKQIGLRGWHLGQATFYTLP